MTLQYIQHKIKLLMTGAIKKVEGSSQPQTEARERQEKQSGHGFYV